MITLKNKYIVKSMIKTTAEALKNVKVGDILNIELTLTHHRSGDNNSLVAYYPKINGIMISVAILNKLINKGLILEEINMEG